MALRLKGLASADAITEMTGLGADHVATALTAMIEAEHAKEGPRGFQMLPEGKAWTDGLIEAERAAFDATAMDGVYDRFCEHNGDFKQLITDWQIKIVDGEQTMNDHADTDYDAAIFARLRELDGAVAPVFADASALAPRLARYIQRFAEALGHIQAGDQSYVASPLKDSYHTVWFEMHEELILLSGRNRADEAAAGRGA